MIRMMEMDELKNRKTTTSSAAVRIMRNICDISVIILFVGTAMNYTRRNRCMGFAVVKQRRSRRQTER
jgi:hypothetical protein